MGRYHEDRDRVRISILPLVRDRKSMFLERNLPKNIDIGIFTELAM
jgi:hypothetical protein